MEMIKKAVLLVRPHAKLFTMLLMSLSVTQLETKDVTIIVEYSHPIQSINISYSFQLNVTVLGVGQPSLICESNGSLHYSSQNNTNVSISFDGVTFSNCNGYWNKRNSEWITGYGFFNFHSIDLRNVIVTNSSDVILVGNKFVSIVNCSFQNNVYHYGLVYISALNDETAIEGNGTIISNVIENSTFNGNTGLVNALRTPFATVTGMITINNEKLLFVLVISDCIFQENQIINPDSNQNAEVAEVQINVTDASLNLLNITIKNSLFTNHSVPASSPVSNSKMIQVTCATSKYETFNVNITSNSFFNNSIRGEIVAFHLTDLTSLLQTEIVYEMNNAVSNIGDCLSVYFSNVSNPKTVLIRHSTFVKNYGKAIYVICNDCPFPIPIVDVSSVEISKNTIISLETGVMEITQCELYLVDSQFFGNTGTAARIKDTHYYSEGETLFDENAGTYGGGLSFVGSTKFFINNANLTFTNNVALYGGGIYNSIITFEGEECNAIVIVDCNVGLRFRNNTASSSGDNAFFEDITLASCIGKYLHKCFGVPNLKSLGFGSSAVIIHGIYGNYGNNNTLTLFPGRNVFINSSVHDAFELKSSCEATVYLQCVNQAITCENNDQFIRLEGPTIITIGSRPYTSNIKLLASNNISNSIFTNPSLQFKCPYTQIYTMYLDIIDCPIGFVYNETTSSCQCAFQDHNAFICSLPLGKACVAKGYWLGVVEDEHGEDVTVISQCLFHSNNCNANSSPCPNSVGRDASSYVLVGLAQDDQCGHNHGGILCSNCRDGATLSFEGLHCIDNNECEPWQPYMILILVVIFQLILSYTIQLFLSIQNVHGIGFLFGPLFFLAVVNVFPLENYDDFYYLKILISLFTSIFLLNMEVFGQIKWCFFSTLIPLENYAFHYLGPLIVFIVVMATVLVSRKCPKFQKHVHISPIQTICLLLLLSFWSLMDTNIHINEAVTFSGVDDIRYALQPDLEYSTGIYTILTILVVIINLIVILSILFMFLAPFIAKKISLYRIQPLLDQFQSIYKDKYRWYPSVYMIIWILILVAQHRVVMLQIILAVKLLALIVFQPYSTKWLNITNLLLVTDSIMIISLIEARNNPYYDYAEQVWVKPMLVVLIHLLTILPLLYMVCGMVWIVTMRFKIHIYLKKLLPTKFRKSKKTDRFLNKINPQFSQRRKVRQQDVVLFVNSDEHFREPLIDELDIIEESTIEQ